MSLKHTITIALARDSGLASLSGRQTEVGSGEIPIDQTFPAASSAAAVTGIVFAFANLQSIYVVADKNCSITFVGGAGVTVALVAGIPFYWEKSAGYFANPFAANVTGATLTCTPSVTLKGGILVS